MKKTALTVIASFALVLAIAQEQKPISNNFAFGFQLGQYQKDFGVGLNLTSPYFLHNSIAVRVRGNVMWNEHPLNGEMTWSNYSNLSIGVIGVGGTIGNFARLYGEGGMLIIFPNTDFSSTSTELGGYGLFGFEFFMAPKINYFIEIGGVGTGAKADKIATKPIYSNGLLINVGFRAYL